MKNNSENKTERTIGEIREQLRSGDQLLLSEITECTSDYVSMVIRGIRKSERILKLANELIDNRDAFVTKHKSVK